MQADKKKILIISLLGVALLGVGAWQLLGGKSNPPATPRKEHKTSTPDNTTVASTGTGTGPETAVAPDISLVGLKPKDPFVPGKLKDEPPSRLITPVKPPVNSGNGQSTVHPHPRGGPL